MPAEVPRLIQWPDCYAVCRLAPHAEIPSWAQGSFVSLTRTRDELSIVCPQKAVPADVQCERNWAAFQVEGPLDCSQVGVIAAFSHVLSDAGIPMFVISTFDTDYLLVPEERAADVCRLCQVSQFES